MAEYIEREVLDNFKNEIVSRFIALCFGNDYNKLSLLTIANNIDEIYEKYRTRTAADVEEVRHGEWVSADNDGEWKCSLCGGEIVVDAYGDIHPLDDCGWIGCPYCLAKMDGKGEGE